MDSTFDRIPYRVRTETWLTLVCVGLVSNAAAQPQESGATTTDSSMEESGLPPPEALDTAATPATGIAEPTQVNRDTDIAPLDFCGLAPKRGTGAFQRQRVVMLDVARDPSLQSGPEVELVVRDKKSFEVPRSIFRTIDAFGHAREVLMTVFPMKRHYLVLAGTIPTPIFAAKKPISLGSAKQLLAADSLAAYSVGCADWLVAPYLSRGKVVWSKQTRTKTVVDANGKSHEVKYSAWDVNVPLHARLEVYRRVGDRFVHHASLSGNPTGSAAGEALDWNNPAQVHEVVSVAVPEGCSVSGGPDAAAALRSCGGSRLELSPKDTPPTLGGAVRSSHYCADIDDAVRSDQLNMPPLALCELRVAAEYTAVDLQLHGKQMCGWKLFSPLLEVPGRNELGVSMGEYEGAARGDYYIAYLTSSGEDCSVVSEEGGFGRIYDLGPGGDAGFTDPSEVHFQAGQPMVGVRMEEFAMHGLRFALQPSAALLLGKGDLESTFAGGSLFEFGYDLTRWVPFLDEIWLEAQAGVLFGSELFIPLSAGVEGATYFGNSWSLVTGVGLAFTLASKTLVRDVDITGKDISVSGSALGLEARAGFNYAIRPNWHARAMVEVRSGFGSTALKNEKELPDYELDAGPLLMSMLTLSVSYTY